MKRLLSALSFVVALVLVVACTPRETKTAEALTIRYGANEAVGATFVHDGVTLYYETYGQGEPLLLVHGNGGSIGTLAAQIDHFKTRYKVIAMDSRDHGRSADSQEPITYEKMTDDLAALIDHLKLGPVDVVGWSDGGIEALLLDVRHPAKVKKIVSMAANLNPSPEAFDPEVDAMIKSMMELPDEARNTPEGRRQLKVVGMMLKEPDIPPAMLAKVAAPRCCQSDANSSPLDTAASNSAKRQAISDCHSASAAERRSLYVGRSTRWRSELKWLCVLA